MRGRVDVNHAEIRDALAMIPGVTVIDLSDVGGGVTDLLVGRAGVNYLIEIKKPAAPMIRRKHRHSLTPAQQRFHAEWRGQKAVVETLDEALAVIGIRRAA